MKKLWLILWHEYKRHVMRKRFIFAILSMPLFVGFMALIGFLSVWLQFDEKPVGYVDPFHILVNPQPVPEDKNDLFKAVPIVQFEDDSSAQTALESDQIQAYFVMSEEYLSTGEVTMVTLKKPGTNASEDFGKFLSFNLLKGQPEPVIHRLTEGKTLIIRSLDGSRELGADNWLVVVLPIIAGVLFIITVNISGGYLLQAVVEEKENRTMEILVTSVSPTQLMAGKVIGNLSVGLTQLVIWILFTVIAVNLAPLFFPDIKPPELDFSYILLLIATLLPAFVMVAAAMGAIGATASELREAQQLVGWFTLPIVVPFWFITPIMFNPNGALAVGLSLFPFTAPIALPLRAVFTDIPIWQNLLTVVLLCGLAIFALWLAGRVFRLGMLRYGKRISLKEAFLRS
jgi:ABC-2 type transport system permease protein